MQESPAVGSWLLMYPIWFESSIIGPLVIPFGRLGLKQAFKVSTIWLVA